MKCVSIRSFSDGSRVHVLEYGMEKKLGGGAVVFEDSFGQRRYMGSEGYEFLSEGMRKKCDKAIDEYLYLNGEKP